MKFICPSCKAKYQIADEKIADRSVRMKCRKCARVIRISKQGVELSESGPPDVTSRPPAMEGTHVAILEGTGLIVELIQRPGARGPDTSDATLRHGLFKAGVVVDDYDALLRRLREQSVPIAMGPFPARESQRANFILRDNAGNLLQFISRR